MDEAEKPIPLGDRVRAREKRQRKREGKPTLGRPALTEHERRGRAKIARYDADIERLLDEQIRLAEWLQEALRNELVRGYAGKQTHIALDDVTKMDKVTGMVQGLLQAKARWHALAKAMGGKLTAAEKLEAAAKRIEKLPTRERRDVINRLVAHHNATREHDGQWGIKDVDGNRPDRNHATDTQVPSPAPQGPATAIDAIASLGD